MNTTKPLPTAREPSSRANPFRPLRSVRTDVSDLDSIIEAVAARRPALSRVSPGERGLLIAQYLERLSTLLAEDLPHTPPPELHPSLRKN